MAKFSGNAGIGCISDTDPQPLLVRSHLGMFAISTVGIINNAEQLVAETFSGPGHQFMACLLYTSRGSCGIAQQLHAGQAVTVVLGGQQKIPPGIKCGVAFEIGKVCPCLLYTSPDPVLLRTGLLWAARP